MTETIATVLEQVASTGLALFLVVGAALFVAARVWPWFTKVYLPGKAAHEQQMAEIQLQTVVALREATTATLQLGLSAERLGDAVGALLSAKGLAEQ